MSLDDLAAAADHDDPETGRVRALLSECYDDPALFQTAVLGRELYSKQIEMSDAVGSYPITVVPAGRAVGKSYWLAGVVLWWLYTRPYSLVITTGPDHRQVVTVLWKEIRRALRPRYDRDGNRVSPRVPLPYDHLTDGHGSPQVLTVVQGTEWGALGFASKTEEGFSGQHAGELLVIVDEASGVKDSAWTSIHGLAATKMVLCGNPIKYHCHFRELYELSETSNEIASVTISSLDSPHATLDKSPVGMASASFLRQMAEIHGTDSPWWRSNILGLFPGAETTTFVPRQWLDGCTSPEVLDDPLWLEADEGPARMGIDPSLGVGADRSAVVVRNNKRLLRVFASPWYGLDDDAKHPLVPKVLELAAEWDVAPEHTVYDKNGPGRHLGSHLAAAGFDGAVGYFGGGKGGTYYADRRTACAFAFKRRLDARRAGYVPFYADPALPEWAALRRELRELRLAGMEMVGGQVKQKIEDKADLMQRLRCSPDLMDAFLMTYTFTS